MLATVSRPSDRRGPNTLKDADVTLSEYDAKAGRAVVSDGDRGGGGVDIRKGDVIASPPTKAAPEGALEAGAQGGSAPRRRQGGSIISSGSRERDGPNPT